MKFTNLIVPFVLCGGMGIVEAAEPVEGQDIKNETKESTKRKSKVQFSLFSGRDEFRESELSAVIGLDAIWALTGALGVEKSAGTRTASSFALGTNAKLSPDFDANISISSRREPESVVARGLTMGVNWNFASLWGAELASEIGIQSTFMRYKQDQGTHTRVRDGGISQNSLVLSFSQEFTEKWALNTSYTAYGLGGANAAELSRAIGSRPNVSPGFLSVVEGFPKRAYGIGSDYQPEEDWSLGVQLFRTDYYDGSHGRGLSLSSHFDLKKEWGAGIGLSGTRNDTTEQKSALLELSVSYRF